MTLFQSVWMLSFSFTLTYWLYRWKRNILGCAAVLLCSPVSVNALLICVPLCYPAALTACVTHTHAHTDNNNLPPLLTLWFHKHYFQPTQSLALCILQRLLMHSPPHTIPQTPPPHTHTHTRWISLRSGGRAATVPRLRPGLTRVNCASAANKQLLVFSSHSCDWLQHRRRTRTLICM